MKLIDQNDSRIRVRSIPWYTWWRVSVFVASVLLVVLAGLFETHETLGWAFTLTLAGGTPVVGTSLAGRVSRLTVDLAEGTITIEKEGLLRSSSRQFDLSEISDVSVSGGRSGRSIFATYRLKFAVKGEEYPVDFGEATAFVGRNRSAEIGELIHTQWREYRERHRLADNSARRAVQDASVPGQHTAPEDPEQIEEGSEQLW